MKRGKKYQDAVKAFDRANQYDVAEAIDIVKKNATAKFDETIELHLRTGCDGRHAEQQIRGAVDVFSDHADVRRTIFYIGRYIRSLR